MYRIRPDNIYYAYYYYIYIYLHKVGPQVLRHVILDHGDEEEPGADTRDGQLKARVFGGEPAQDPS